MALQLYYHPLSSFCWKALIALYENDTPFRPVPVDLTDPGHQADDVERAVAQVGEPATAVLVALSGQVGVGDHG